MSKQMLTHDMAHVNRTKLIKKQKERKNSKFKLPLFQSKIIFIYRKVF